jgi:hypothetical protein
MSTAVANASIELLTIDRHRRRPGEARAQGHAVVRHGDEAHDVRTSDCASVAGNSVTREVRSGTDNQRCGRDSSLLDQRAHAVRAKDAEAAIRPYASDAVNFGLAPPLAHGGAEATNPESQKSGMDSACVCT